MRSHQSNARSHSYLTGVDPTYGRRPKIEKRAPVPTIRQLDCSLSNNALRSGLPLDGEIITS